MPSEFWRMTPADFWLMHDGKVEMGRAKTHTLKPMTLDELHALEKRIEKIHRESPVLKAMGIV